jgi:hypothetical protein
MNRNTRIWDDTDCFLWMRWAGEFGATAPALPMTRFAEELGEADESLLRLIARRTLRLRQAMIILRAPLTYRSFFLKMLSECIQLNNNETILFVDWSCDLKKRLKAAKLEDVFTQPTLVGALTSVSDSRQRGERLLKEMRLLRYPEYQKKSEEFTSYWQQLDVGQNVQVKKDRFLENGKLDITLSAGSHQEMMQSVDRLYRSLNSPWWERIWE